MNKKSVLNRLSSLKAPLMAVGVSQLGLFGSTVRGENTRKSDIDILIDFNADQETYLKCLYVRSVIKDDMQREEFRKHLIAFWGV